MSERVGSAETTFWADGDDRLALQYYRTLVDAVEGGVFQLDADDRFVAIDHTLLELTGYARNDLLGEPVSLLFADRDVERLESRIVDGGRDDTDAEATVAAGGSLEIAATITIASGASVPCDLRLDRVPAPAPVRDGDGQTDGERAERGRENHERNGGSIGIVRVDDADRRRESASRSPSEPSESSESLESPESPESFESIAAVLEEADVGVFVLDNEFDVSWINEATERYFGLDRAAVLGRDKRALIDETIRNAVADPETFEETVVATYEDNSYVERFECHVTPDLDDGREERWLEHRSKPIESGPYAGGRVELYYDITDRHRRATQLRRLNEAVREWLEGTTHEAVAEQASAHISTILDLEINGFFRYDEGSEELRPVAWSDAAETLFGDLPTFAPGEGIAWRVFESGEPAIYDDVRTVPDIYNPETPIRSEIILPVGAHGILIIGSREHDAFDDGDLTLAKIVASSLEVTFDRLSHERTLERERTQTEQLLQTAPVAIAVEDADGETLLANQRAQEALGLTEAEIFGELETDAPRIVDATGDRLEPDELPSARVRETGEPVLDEELVIERSTGERTWLSVNATPVFTTDGTLERVITAGEDITALKEHERRLERRKSELETELSEILGRVSDAFYALDDEWRFTHLNDRASELLNRPRESLLGSRVWDEYPDVDPIFQERFEEAMASQQPVSFETYDDAHDLWLEFNVYPSETGLSVYFRDVTERKESQRKLEESNERLEQFAYAASHDLQEPLRMVSSYLQLIDQRYGSELGEDGDGQEFLDYAIDGADRMREMIDGLLEYSRVETRGDSFEPVDLEEVLEDVRSDLQVRIAEQDADVTVDSLPTVHGDAGQLRQVFQNLLSNAIEYSGDEPPAVAVSADRDGDTWLVSVRDEGIGIDPDDRERVFEVFQRLHTHDEHAGTGIGLALCKRIVERHGGEIRVDSEPGEGSTFSVVLPAVDDVE
ncbi:PAS domain S-box protein [Natronoglomus mannanivorans]|uniref:histidine kinase n=1 Tax=Natronoglomus mannanivorans TaxID=2979990 RepID=A0AAP2Z119_9EURY|nr:PAS domain S-box protein [Halobacteria archaeon AArc-xg1-1]